MHHRQFKDIVKASWQRSGISGWAGYVILKKLQRLRSDLTAWNRNVFGFVEDNIRRIDMQIQELDLFSEERALTPAEVEMKICCLKDKKKMQMSLDRIWHQKSRLNWYLHGDKNSSFFHAIANHRQNVNMINSIQKDGRLVDLPLQMKEAAQDHFRILFNERWKCRPCFVNAFGPKLDSAMAASLEVRFTDEEVWNAVQSCNGGKAPGPDGFNLSFFKHCWEVVKEDISRFFHEFFENGRIVKGLRSSFISLIPKTDSPTSLNEYRPISLVGSIYKILAKVLSNRLKSCIHLIIGEVQAAFVGSRSILDGVLIASEAIHWLKSRKRSGVIVKLDFAKAYDSVNWNYLLNMMRLMGFGDKWIRWIEACVTSANFSVLINGSPTKLVHMEKGICQGDPLSPFLFIIAAEGLNWLFKRARELGLINGILLGSGDLRLTHLQFADDTILFCADDMIEIQNVKMILKCFELMSGLRVNFHKSVVCGLGVSKEKTSALADVFNCQVQPLPFKYLGIPLGANPRLVKTWKPVIDRCRKRLASWKRRYLSMAGRLVLIKSVLSSLPLYFLSLFKMPEGVAQEIDKLRARFLWGDSVDRKKLHLIRWANVIKAKSDGGLGVKDLRVMNDCLLSKWIWKFGRDRSSLWRSVVCEVYNVDKRDWFINSNVFNGRVSRVWQNIVGIKERRPNLWEFLLNKMAIRIGNGISIRFWHDRWIGNQPLKLAFPRLFAAAVHKDLSLDQVICNPSGERCWSLDFGVSLGPRQRSQLHSLFAVIGRPPRLSRILDEVIWVNGARGDLSVKVLYEWIAGQSGRLGNGLEIVWSKIVPPRIQVFGWKVWHGRVQTLAWLREKGVRVENDMCVLCGVVEESVDHLFLHCRFVWTIWASCFRWWGFMWVAPDSVQNLLRSWDGVFIRKELREFWRAIPGAVFWFVWKCRNDSRFNNIEPRGDELFELIKYKCALWFCLSSRRCDFNVFDLTFKLDCLV
ncbi:hypothetical protein Dimus_038529 [Dionaea muscipula]